MIALLRRVESAWLAPAPPARLAVIRVVTGLFCAGVVLAGWSEVPGLAADPTGRYFPVGLARLLPRPDQATLQNLQVAVLALAVLWTAGLAWRLTAPLFAASFLLWGAWRLSWGAIAHDLHLAGVQVAVLALTPAAAALSLDARLPTLLAWRPAPWVHGWGVRLLCVATVVAYFLAGVAKLDAGGLGWGRGENLLDQLAYANLVRTVYEPDRPAPLGLWLVQSHGWILSAGAVLTLVVELGAPLALLHRRIGYAWAFGTLAMHLGIAALMGITFPYQTWGLAFLPFLPVERLVPARLRG